MSHVQRVSVEITTASDGSATAYIGSDTRLTGKLIAIGYKKNNFADGHDVVATVEYSAQPVWTKTNVDASVQVYPRHPTNDYLAAASLYAATGEPVEDHIYLAEDRIKIVIASGGDTKTGTYYALIA